MIRRLGNAILATGSSQIFWYLSLPFIGKLYSQEDIGLYSQVAAYAATIGLIIGARSDLAVLTSPSWKTGVTRKAFEKLAAVLILPVGVVSLLIGYLSGNKVLELPLVLAVLAGGCLSNLFLLNGVSLVKAADYSSLRNSGLLRSISQAVAQLSMSIFGLWGLIGGKFLGDVLGVVIRKNKLPQERKIQHKWSPWVFQAREWAVIKRNAPAFKYSLPQSVISSATQNAPYFLLPIALLPAEMGQFAMAFTLVISPVGLIGAPIRQTFMAHFSARAIDHAQGSNLLITSTTLLLVAGITGYAALYMIAPHAILLAFGTSWAEMTDYVRVLAGWSAIGVASIPAVAYLLSYERNRLHLKLEVLTGIGRVAALLAGILYLDGWRVLVPFVLISILFSLVTIGCAFSHMRQEARR